MTEKNTENETLLTMTPDRQFLIKKIHAYIRMSDNIIRCTFNDYNNTPNPRVIELKPLFNNVIVSKADDYTVSIEKCAIPLDFSLTPIDKVDKPYAVNLFLDDKDIPFDNLEYGNNLFYIRGPIYSVEEFVQKMNDIVFKKPQNQLTLGRFFLDGHTIKWFVQQGDETNFSIIQIYFDRRLTKLFNFNYDFTDSMNVNNYELVRFKMEEQGTFTQHSYTYDLFYKIVSVCIHSNLPTGKHYVIDTITNTMCASNILQELYFNPQSYIENNRIFYIPTLEIKNSLHMLNEVTDINIWFTFKYADSTETAILLDVDSHARLTLKFEKK